MQSGMNRLVLIPAIVVALAAAGAARADLVPVRGAEAGACCVMSVGAHQATPLGGSVAQGVCNAAWSESGFPLPLSAAPLPVPPAGPRELQTQELPAAPDSAVLCLSALAGLGVWHLGRSARKLDFGVVPEWYHAAGPTQVGHATPLDLEFSLSAMPICRFEVPVATGDAQPSEIWLRHEPILRLHSQYILLMADPRGPPSFS